MRRSEFPTVRAPLSQVVDRAPTGGEQLLLWHLSMALPTVRGVSSDHSRGRL